ncbi:MAG TPA: response regulator transcription factor [bacterium]|nr:response regulator transcription factor [bacterium]
MAIRVLLANAQPVMLEGLKAVFAGEPDIEVQGEATTGAEVYERALTLRPDVVVMDIKFEPDNDATGLIRTVKEQLPDTQVLVFTVHADVELLQKAARAGAAGYVNYDISAVNLARAVRAVHGGATMINPRLARRLLADMDASANGAAGWAALHRLTGRELEVLVELGHGLGDKEIAEKLYVSQTTIKAHLRTIYRKLRVRNRVQAVAFVANRGLLKTS